jgi:ABC-type Na+ efflux pump permease subunit
MEIAKTSEHVMKKSLGFWIGMTVWIAPPLLALIVWTIS